MTESKKIKDSKTEKKAILLLKEIVEAFPEHNTNEEIDGADTVEWLMAYITKVKKLLK